MQNIFLDDYSLTTRQKLLFPLTASPYVLRHWKKGTLAHRVVALIEAVPILGSCVAIIERIAYSRFSNHTHHPLTHSQIRSLEKQEKKLKAFENEALQRLEKKELPKATPSLAIDHGEIQKTIQSYIDRSLPMGRYTRPAGNSLLFHFPDHPNLIVKWTEKDLTIPQGKPRYFTTKEVDFKAAQKICEEENLFLLHIPETEVIQIHIVDRRGKAHTVPVVIQEKSPLFLEGNFYTQKGLWNWIGDSPALTEYRKELIRQLTRLTCRLGFKDVKFDNTLFRSDGLLTLPDLDQRGLAGGLTESNMRSRKGGLLRYLRESEWEMVMEQIAPFPHGVSKETMTDLFHRMQKRCLRQQEYRQFCQTHKIQHNRQPLRPLRKQKGFTGSIIRQINGSFSQKKNPNLYVGRRVKLPIGEKSALFRAAPGPSFRTQLASSLDTLQQSGHIFHYTFKEKEHVVVIRC